jgi:hypothetical protein
VKLLVVAMRFAAALAGNRREKPVRARFGADGVDFRTPEL